MQAAARFNPLTYVVDAQRALFAGQIASATVAWGWVAALVTAAVGLTIGVRIMARSAD
jgi:ABC-2 type transport system permease protein